MTGLESALASLPSVSLDELDTVASLQNRVERKYVVDPAALAGVLSSLETPASVLQIAGQRTFGYESLYFDTEDLQSYRDAARRRPRRFKVRLRTYLDTGATALEVKRREASGRTVKERTWCSPDAYRDGWWRDDARKFLASFPQIAAVAPTLAPVLRTTYQRTTLLVGDARVTIDANVTAADPEDRSVTLGDELVVETKVSRHAGDFDRQLWRAGIRPERLSKYCTSLAALDPELPHHRWRRTLARHSLIPAGAVAA